jgi:hypothetical protein
MPKTKMTRRKRGREKVPSSSKLPGKNRVARAVPAATAKANHALDRSMVNPFVPGE